MNTYASQPCTNKWLTSEWRIKPDCTWWHDKCGAVSHIQQKTCIIKLDNLYQHDIRTIAFPSKYNVPRRQHNLSPLGSDDRTFHCTTFAATAMRDRKRRTVRNTTTISAPLPSFRVCSFVDIMRSLIAAVTTTIILHKRKHRTVQDATNIRSLPYLQITCVNTSTPCARSRQWRPHLRLHNFLLQPQCMNENTELLKIRPQYLCFSLLQSLLRPDVNIMRLHTCLQPTTLRSVTHERKRRTV